MERIPSQLPRLSVNVNKIATLRNARGGNYPDIVASCESIQQMGADGVTVHPRPDGRHIRYEDVRAISSAIDIEFNVEGNPQEPHFIQLVLDVKPTQVTLVPDTAHQITSNHGWDTILHKEYLKGVISQLKHAGIRTSIFVDPDRRTIKGAAEVGTDRVELYTESYATNFVIDQTAAIRPYILAAKKAHSLGLAINAGHDLNSKNLAFFCEYVSPLSEISIGHALICDALYEGLARTIGQYKTAISEGCKKRIASD